MVFVLLLFFVFVLFVALLMRRRCPSLKSGHAQLRRMPDLGDLF